MPIYEYVCKNCSKKFEILLRGSERPACPSCGGKRLDKQLSVFATSSSSGNSRESLPDPCRSCGDPRGPGSCGFA